MRNRFFSVLIALCALQAAPATAGVVVVSASGGGAFTDLPAAVAAAVDGDVLLVKSGVYAGTTIANKALDLVADTGAGVVIQGQLAVTGLSATRAVTLTGFTLRATSGLAAAVSLLSSSGSIRIQGCTVEGFDQPDCAPPYPSGGIALSVVNATDVSITRCTLTGGRAGNYSGYVDGSHGASALVASGARIALYESVARGGRGGSLGGPCASGYGYPGDGGDGAFTTSCPTFFASGSELIGGDAGGGGYYDACAGAGVRSSASALTTLDSSIVRGSFPPGSFEFLCSCLAAVCPNGAPSQVVLGPARRFVVTRVAREQGSVRFDFFGVPGDQVELLFATRGAFVPAPGGTGVGLLRRERPGLVAQIGTIGPSGQLSRSWTVPDQGAGVLGTRLFAQADFIEPTGRTLRGPPATIVLLDASL